MVDKIITVPVAEQETTIQFCRNEDVAHICTSDSTMKTKFEKLCKGNQEHWKKVADDGVYATYECTPKTLVSFRAKTSERVMTEEQKKEIADRLHGTRNRQS